MDIPTDLQTWLLAGGAALGGALLNHWIEDVKSRNDQEKSIQDQIEQASLRLQDLLKKCRVIQTTVEHATLRKNIESLGRHAVEQAELYRQIQAELQSLTMVVTRIAGTPGLWSVFEEVLTLDDQLIKIDRQVCDFLRVHLLTDDDPIDRMMQHFEAEANLYAAVFVTVRSSIVSVSRLCSKAHAYHRSPVIWTWLQIFVCFTALRGATSYALKKCRALFLQ